MKKKREKGLCWAFILGKFKVSPPPSNFPPFKSKIYLEITGGGGKKNPLAKILWVSHSFPLKGFKFPQFSFLK